MASRALRLPVFFALVIAAYSLLPVTPPRAGAKWIAVAVLLLLSILAVAVPPTRWELRLFGDSPGE
jgi:hypothetical protein